MNGLSFSATTEKRKGILLDPRTKLILLLTITTLMFSTSNEGIMNIVKPCLSLVPFALILSERRFKTAGKYLVLYAVCFILERIELILDCCTDIVHFEDGSIIDQFPMDADGLEKIRNYFIKGVSVK